MYLILYLYFVFVLWLYSVVHMFLFVEVDVADDVDDELRDFNLRALSHNSSAGLCFRRI